MGEKETMKPHSRYEVARKILIFWCLFIGLGAVAGAVGMLTAPDGSNLGMQDMLPFFQVLPFADVLYQDYVFPGIALLCVNGIPNLVAAALLFKKKQAGITWGAIFGVTLMAWILIQFVIFPPNFMSTTYFIFGILQALTGCAAWIFYQQEHFLVDPADYPNIGSNKRNLVVYFSRMGYTKKAAYEAANATGAELYEIQSAQRTAGTLGFWWCGRYGMHRWAMPIETIKLDLAAYDHVTICTPVWVFHLAPPMRSFCLWANGEIKEADYIITHFNPVKYKGVAVEMDALLGIAAKRAKCVCVQWGRIIQQTDIRSEGDSYEN